MRKNGASEQVETGRYSDPQHCGDRRRVKRSHSYSDCDAGGTATTAADKSPEKRARDIAQLLLHANRRHTVTRHHSHVHLSSVTPPSSSLHARRPRERLAENAGHTVVANGAANRIYELFVYVARDLTVYYSLEHEASGRACPWRWAICNFGSVQALRGAANEKRVDSGFFRDLLDFAQRQRIARLIGGLFGLLKLRRALDYQRNFFFTESAAGSGSIGHARM
jgi:hypothetical protein